jgi:hypothetical protein
LAAGHVKAAADDGAPASVSCFHLVIIDADCCHRVRSFPSATLPLVALPCTASGVSPEATDAHGAAELISGDFGVCSDSASANDVLAPTLYFDNAVGAAVLADARSWWLALPLCGCIIATAATLGRVKLL